MTRSKKTLAMLFGGMMLGAGSAGAGEPAMPWVENPELYAPDDLSVYNEDYAWLRDRRPEADVGPTLFAAGDGKPRPWTEHPWRYAPDAMSAYSGDYRWLATDTRQTARSDSVAQSDFRRGSGTLTAHR